MKVLALVPAWPWPARQGVAIRASKILEALAGRHRVSVIGFKTGAVACRPDFLEHSAMLESPSRSLVDRALWMARLKPDLAGRRFAPSIVEAVAEAVARWEPDVLMVFGLELAPIVPSRNGPRRPIVVYDAQNCESALQLSAARADALSPPRWHRVLYSLIQWALLSRFEEQWLRRADAVVAVSDGDRRRLSALSGRHDIAVVPNGVDPSYLARENCGPLPQEPRLVFTGQMNYRPNVDAAEWFARRVLPRLRGVCPEVHFYIVGRDPAPSVRRLGRSAGVIVTGEVEDVREHLCTARCFVAPIRMGGGTRLKVLEAAAMELPVVATRLAVEGTDLKPQEHFFEANDAPSFAHGVLWVLANPGEAQAMAARAGALVRRLYAWSVVAPKYLDVVESAVG